MYKIFITEEFRRVFVQCDGAERLWIEKVKEGLAHYPSGKIIHFPWFREKKFGNKRLYFIIDEVSQRILLINFSNKKEQKITIRFILKNMSVLFEELRSD